MVKKKAKKPTGPKLEMLKIDSLKPAKYNPRKMDKAGINKLAQSMKEFGIVEPIVVNADLTIIGGHQRVYAAEQIKLSKVPCIRVDIPKPKEKALNLALNKIHGEWDVEKLALVLGELSADEEIDELISGFDSLEIDNILGDITEDPFDLVNKIEPEFENKQETILFTVPEWETVNAAIQEVQAEHPDYSRGKALSIVCEQD